MTDRIGSVETRPGTIFKISTQRDEQVIHDSTSNASPVTPDLRLSAIALSHEVFIPGHLPL